MTFKGPPGNMGNLMKQAQMMQSKLAKLQEGLAEKTAEGTAGGGTVKVVANGKNQLVSIMISREVIDPNDPEMLQDLVLTASNQALKNIHDQVNDAMKQITGGMGMPGMF
jgi:DNA-binding YbaB/EbfC family protein